MHGLVLIFLGTILASTVQAGVVDYDWFGSNSYGVGGYLMAAPKSNGVRGCTGKLIVEPPFKKGDIE